MAAQDHEQVADHRGPAFVVQLHDPASGKVRQSVFDHADRTVDDLLAGGDDRVLIDALFGSGIPGYPAVEPGLRSRLERGEGLGAGVDEDQRLQPRRVPARRVSGPSAPRTKP